MRFIKKAAKVINKTAERTVNVVKNTSGKVSRVLKKTTKVVKNAGKEGITWAFLKSAPGSFDLYIELNHFKQNKIILKYRISTEASIFKSGVKTYFNTIPFKEENYIINGNEMIIEDINGVIEEKISKDKNLKKLKDFKFKINTIKQIQDRIDIDFDIINTIVQSQKSTDCGTEKNKKSQVVPNNKTKKNAGKKVKTKQNPNLIYGNVKINNISLSHNKIKAGQQLSIVYTVKNNLKNTCTLKLGLTLYGPSGEIGGKKDDVNMGIKSGQHEYLRYFTIPENVQPGYYDTHCDLRFEDYDNSVGGKYTMLKIISS